MVTSAGLAAFFFVVFFVAIIKTLPNSYPIPTTFIYSFPFLASIMPSKTDIGTILCICAHSDDQIFGPGGTLAKYAKEGKKVITFILSYGEMSHPYFKEEVVIRTRVKEAQVADKIIGGSGVIFFGLKEGKFKQSGEKKDFVNKLVEHFHKLHPERILMHSSDDTHPDHRASFHLVKEAYDKSKLTCPVYTFDVWAPFSLHKRSAPRLVVDVSKTYRKKLDAIKSFKSQLGVLQFLNWYVFARMLITNAFNGLKYGHRFVEVFYKLR